MIRALTLALLTAAALLVLPARLEAVGPVVGTGCVANWSPMTTNVGGTPVIPPITYRVYVYTATPPVIGTTPPTVTTQLTDGVKICAGLTPGTQYNYVVSAVETFAPGDVTEGTPSDPFPFVPDAPGKVGGAGLR